MAHYDRFERRKVHVNRQAMGGGGNVIPTTTASTTTTSASQTSASSAHTSLSLPTSSSTSTSSTPTTTSTTTTSSTTSSSTTSSSSSATSSSATSSTISTIHTTSQTSVAAPGTTFVSPTTTSKTTAHVTRTATLTSGTASASGSVASANASGSSSSVGTGTIIGIALGCIVGLAVISALIVMALRRYKKRKEEEEVFSASQFRRSAVLLDDEMDQPMGGAPYGSSFSNSGHSAGGNQYGNGGGSGYGTTLRPPTMIERHMNNSPASFAHPQFAGYAPQPPQPAFGPGEVMGHNVYSEQDIRAAPFDGDPFSPTRDPYLTRQPSSASGMYHPDHVSQQYDHQQFPPVPQHTQDPFNSQQHASYNSAAPQFEQPQQQQYADVNRVTSMSSDSTHAHASIIAAAGVAMPEERHEHQASTPNTPHHAPAPHEVPIPPSPMFPPDAAASHTSSGVKRPDTVYDPEDAYGGM